MQEVRIIRSRRRSLSISVTPEAEVIVRAPLFMSDGQVRRIVEEKSAWIQAQLDKARRVQKSAAEEGLLSPEDIRRLAKEAKKVIPGRCEHYAQKMGVSFQRISIRSQRTRWGSCSREGNLNFNCLLMLCPPEVLDSVVVHELAHRKHMDHSAAFYAEIYKVFPEYERWNKWLKKNGPVLLKRMSAGKGSK